jgi:hypothetical protein
MKNVMGKAAIHYAPSVSSFCSTFFRSSDQLQLELIILANGNKAQNGHRTFGLL